MTEQSIPSRVEHLKRIGLKLQISQGDRVVGPPVDMDFIYGIGPQGLTPLELQLADQTIGMTVNMDCKVNELTSVLEHLAPNDLRLPLEESGTLHLAATVLRITTPSDREIVKTIAEMARCGDCCGH